MTEEKRPLGEVLIDQGLITPEQLEGALKEQRQTGKFLGHILVSKGFVSEKDILSFLGAEIGIPYVDLSSYLIDLEAIAFLPESTARRYQVIPLFKVEDSLTVAMVDPLDVFALDVIGYQTGCTIDPVLSTESDIRQAIEQYYGVSGSVEEVIKAIDEQELGIAPEEEMDITKLQEIARETPIIKLVNLIIMQAVEERASDIHIEPDRRVLRIRYRVDGILHEVSSLPKHLQSATISRIKVMAELDIAERRKPQSGRVHLRMGTREIDLRISTQPTIFGENMVVRILDKASLFIGLEQLGFPSQTMERFETLIRADHGMVLVTGPTGCGKTTTLYAALSKISSIDKNIMTVEDPVEYQLDLIRQTQINPKADLTFFNQLKAILRQDPDIIMVGEIRDRETAEIAVQAALTGHLVFSTLHTNDAPGALTRLIDMEVEPFLISSSVIGVVAQRLVRTICPICKTAYRPTQKLIEQLGLKEGGRKLSFYKGAGCKNCRQTGYKGRTAVFELMVISDRLKDLIISKTSTHIIKQAACQEGMLTLRDDGLGKVLKGITTIEEIMRVTHLEG